MSALLRLEAVTLWRSGRMLFEGMGLEIGPGEALLVSGPNGSGKSSLIRLAAGLLTASRGRVERAPAALADEAPSVDGELPLRRALCFWAGLQGGGARVDAALGAMGLTELAHVPVRLLSSGQAKRAALARVIASGAPLWLLDEPTNGLDRASLRCLEDAIAVHRASGGAVLAASHAPLAGDWQRLDLGAGTAA